MNIILCRSTYIIKPLTWFVSIHLKNYIILFILVHFLFQKVPSLDDKLYMLHPLLPKSHSLIALDSLRPHRWQPTRLPRPWDSPGKNTGVGCHFLLQCMKVKSESEVTQSCPTVSDPMDCSLPGSSVHGIFPGKSTGVGCHCLLPMFIIHDCNSYT